MSADGGLGWEELIYLVASRHLNSAEEIDAENLSDAASRACEMMLLLDVQGKPQKEAISAPPQLAHLGRRRTCERLAVVWSRALLGALTIAAILSNLAALLTPVTPLCSAKAFFCGVAGKIEHHTLWHGQIVPLLQDNASPEVCLSLSTRLRHKGYLPLHGHCAGVF